MLLAKRSLNEHLGKEAADWAVAQLELGFDGKTLIHPKTIEIANRVFAPSGGEVAWANKIIAAHAAAMAEGKGIVVVDGKLIENLHVLNARRVVDLAAAIAEREARG